MKPRIIARKIKAKLTGKVPCNYNTRHGHDFQRTSDIFEHHGFKYAFFECSVCRMRAEYNQIQGRFTEI